MHSRWQCAEDLSLVFLDSVESIDVEHFVWVDRHEDASCVGVDLLLIIPDLEVP